MNNKAVSVIPITGVINTTEPEWLLEKVSMYGIDLDFEEHVKVCDREFHDECYDSCYDTQYLLGYKKDDKGDYVPDVNAEFSAIVDGNRNITQITLSKWVSSAALCSPCYPGQANLDKEGVYLAYTLPPDVWGSHSHLPIFSVISINDIFKLLNEMKEHLNVSEAYEMQWIKRNIKMLF